MTAEARNDAAPLSDDSLTSFKAPARRRFSTVSELLRQAFSRRRQRAVTYEWFSEAEVGSLDAAGQVDDL
jgi:hypothetical protein